MRRLRDDRGSAIAFFVVFFIVFLGVMALVIDWGSWFTEQRHLQAAADAATLAGAQDLPNTAVASTSATTYAANNISGVNTWAPTFPNTYTIDVALTKKSASHFAKFLGITSMNVHAHAQAQVGTPTSLAKALPVGVRQSVVCTTTSTGCFNVAKTLTFDDSTTTSFGSSTWGLMDLSGSNTSSSACSGKASASEQAGWITSGYPGTLSVSRYYGASTGQRTSIQNALNSRIGQVLLVPVFDSSNMGWCDTGGFHIVGWAAWVIDRTIPNSEWNPHVKTLHGHFTQYIAHDVNSTPGFGGFGVKVINLTQ